MTSRLTHQMNNTGLVRVSEHRGWWLSGHLLVGDHPCFELSFELWERLPPTRFVHPDIKVTYVNVFKAKRNIGEFRVGAWLDQPKPQDHFYFDALFYSCKGLEPQYYVNQEASHDFFRAYVGGMRHVTSGGRL